MTQPYNELRRLLTGRRIRSFERRRQARFLSISRFVAVKHDGIERLARCRDISDGGAKLDVVRKLFVGDEVTITFSPQDVVFGKVVWSAGHEHGIAFDELIDCVRILSGLGMLNDQVQREVQA